MSGDTDTLAVEVVQADGETSLDRHASVYVHTTGLADDALLWRATRRSRGPATRSTVKSSIAATGRPWSRPTPTPTAP